MLDLKNAIAKAVEEHQAERREGESFAAQVEENLDEILAAKAAGIPVKKLAEAAGVPFARFSEAVTRAMRKRQGLTITGKPRKNRKLTGTPAPAALSPRPTFQPPAPPATPAPNPLAPRPANPVAEALAGGGESPVEKKRYISPAARERFASRTNVTGMDQALIEQAKAEQKAIAEGRRSEIEIGGFKK